MGDVDLGWIGSWETEQFGPSPRMCLTRRGPQTQRQEGGARSDTRTRNAHTPRLPNHNSLEEGWSRRGSVVAEDSLPAPCAQSLTHHHECQNRYATLGRGAHESNEDELLRLNVLGCACGQQRSMRRLLFMIIITTCINHKRRIISLEIHI